MTSSETQEPTNRRARLAWHPLLFAAYPVLFLWSQNLGEVSTSDVLLILVMVVAVAAIVLAVLSLLLRDARRAALIVTPIVVGLLMYGHVANLVGHGSARVTAQQLAWVGLVALGILGALRLGESKLQRATRLLDALSVILVAVALITIVPATISGSMASRSTPQESGAATGNATSARPLRDVYYIILDRYGSDSALDLRFGVRNDLTPWLQERGFRVLPDSHANYVKTTLSMASTLNMTHLDTLAARMGPDSSDHAPVFAMLQNSLVVRKFKALGYSYLHIGSWFSPTRTDSAADQNLYVGGPSDFGNALYDVSAAPAFLKRFHLQTANPTFLRAYENNRYAWRALDSVRDKPGPKFVFGHILLPHPPYVFKRDGSFRDKDDGANVPEPEKLADQLAWTNDQLRTWITSLQALPEEQRPIIILQADEGPYTTAYNRNTRTYDWSKATPEDLQVKYGILNAWYVPGGTDIGLYDSMTSVNTFPTLFNGYFGIDTPSLPDREYTSATKDRPYDLTDITDRLDAAAK